MTRTPSKLATKMAVSSRAILRDATCNDIPALICLIRRSWLVAWAPELPFEAVQAFAAADPVTNHVQTIWRSFVVAMIDTDLVGVLHVTGDCIETLHVDHKTWGAGIGSQLMTYAEHQIAKHHAIGRLEVRTFNERAISFYQARGWSEFRRYPGFECNSPIENIEMQKSLRICSEDPSSSKI
ncbi:GNAT family N-acetyltransferase [Tardiphaga robiniae]|uniref:GNAT family N-acetyltransferase n=1 Tax=Tardiphaga robiniae TaxID=943830 RepID=A0A7G6TV62_9BRAD|nr:GNAT family N-acetyltransferase [Tardiphaga robiniae]QND70644.1 GNAT family N-acetyltransferase [Tardiphaga robiniae]